MITREDASRIVSQLIDFCQGDGQYSEWEDDLYSLLDAISEDKDMEVSSEQEG